MNPEHRVRLQAACVLHHRPYRNTSKLLEVFSRDFGRIGLVARGVRRGRSATGSLLQPFAPLLLSWSGRGELCSLTGVEAGGRAHPLTGPKLICGFYMNEVLLRLLHRGDPHPRLYDAYTGSLMRLESEQNVESVLRRFERDLLQEIGYGLSLEHEADSGEPIDPAVLYIYRPDAGPVRKSRGHGDEAVVHGQTLLEIAADNLSEGRSLREAKSLMRGVIDYHLGGKPLHTRSFYWQKSFQ
ncbi:MAG: DNA repair protein RecO [Pseudomonadota bacterium]|nr:MAG: DNA repair protein RecO [Pseudomonadota bacterium]